MRYNCPLSNNEVGNRRALPFFKVRYVPDHNIGPIARRLTGGRAEFKFGETLKLS